MVRSGLCTTLTDLDIISDLKRINLYLTHFFRKVIIEYENVLHKYSSLYLLLTQTAYANYCTRLLLTIRIKRCTTKCLRYKFYGFVDFVHAYTETVQRLIMKFRIFSMIIKQWY